MKGNLKMDFERHAKAEEIINNVKFSYTMSQSQTGLFTKYHTKFQCQMRYNEHIYSATYQCNTQVSNMNNIKKDFLWCTLMDAQAFDYSRDIEDFCSEFGYDYYEEKSKAERAYNSCARAYAAVNRLFTEEELELLNEYFENEGY